MVSLNMGSPAMGSLVFAIKEPQALVQGIEDTLVQGIEDTLALKVKTHNLDQFWEEAAILAPLDIPVDHVEHALTWMRVLCLVCKCKVQSEITPPLSFAPHPPCSHRQS